jgi:hypothetical protein
MKINLISHVLCLGLFAVGCGDPSDRPEVVNKLRSLGVESNPGLIVASTEAASLTTQLTVTMMLPLGETISVESFSDEQPRTAYVAEGLAVDQSSIAYQTFNSMQIASFKANFNNPSDAVFLTQGAGKLLRVRYGFLVKAGTEEEKIVGDVLMLAPGEPELSWSAPTALIENPAAGATIPNAEMELSASVNNPNQESIKLGWYVTSGKIDNRRAKTATWKEFASGPQTIVLTVRGKKSRTFSYSVRDFTVE